MSDDAADRLVLIYTTWPDAEAARWAGDLLVAERLAACVNILPVMISIYEWEGKREQTSEAVMLVKTRGSLEEQVVARVKALHSYTVPALLTIPVTGGNEDYRAWLLGQTTAPGTV